MPYHIIPIRRFGILTLDIRGKQHGSFQSIEDALNYLEQMGYDVIQLIPPAAIPQDDILQVMNWRHIRAWGRDDWIVIAKSR